MSKYRNIVITQQQIQECDVDSVILTIDPEQLIDKQIRALRGKVRIRVEGTNGPSDIFMNPQARNFFRAVHQRWPWQAFFLRVEPITEQSHELKIQDLSLFMALALCHCDELRYCETASGCGLRYNVGELGKIIADMLGRASELGHCVGIPQTKITAREKLVTDSIVSFFDAGKNLTEQLNQHQTRKRK
jgi:hypothetical protein